METKSKLNRFAAVFLALAMLLTLIPFSSIARAEEAASGSGSGKYVLDASDFDVVDKGDDNVGKTLTSKDGYFTVYFSKNTAINSNSKTFDDGFKGTKRLNFNVTDTSTPADVVGFTAGANATVKVWWVKNKADRQVAILDASGTEIKVAAEEGDANALCVTTFKDIPAGKYYLGNHGGGNYIFKIEVTEEAAVAKDYVLDASTDVKPSAAGDFKDGDSAKVGTDEYFTLYYSAKTKVDANKKTFDDGVEGTQRINFGGGIDASTPKEAIGFTTQGAATVKVWWVKNKAARQITIVDGSGTAVYTSEAEGGDNSLQITSIKLEKAGKYFLGNTSEGGNYFFKVQVTEGGGEVVRGDWSKVEVPVVTKAEQASGNINVTVSAVVGNDGGDKVVVEMLDKDGKVVETKQSLAEKSEHTVSFAPKASGTYTFKATLSRDDEETTKVSATKTCDYVLPLGQSTIASVTSMGSGKIALVWSAVDEADSYEVYRDGKKVGSTKETFYTDSGLKVGTKYTYTVAAVRGTDIGPKSAEFAGTATAEAQQVWSFVRFGTSTDDVNNGFEGSANDGKVTVYSVGGKGKVQPGSNDGLAFYYTALPTSTNFTFRAKAHIEDWVVNNGQEGFGLLAMDSVPNRNSADAFWTNKYMAVVSKMEYYWDSEFNEVTEDSTSGTKYTMNLGVGVNTKLGITEKVLEKIKANDSATIKEVCGTQYPLETSAANQGLDAGTYNIAGEKGVDAKGTSIANLTDFVLEIQKNNTGYFISYYDDKGNLIGQKKFYDTDALSKMDAENVYVGFFAARSMKASFSDIQITLTDPAKDAPAEEKPATTVRPNFSFKSASVANGVDYELRVFPNSDGKIDVSVGGTKVLTGVEVKKNDRADMMLKLTAGTSNKISVSFTATGSDTPVVKELTVKIENKFANQNNLYVSPNGTKDGNGGPEHPLDIQTAVNVVRPGQTIVVMEGTYKMTAPVTIERGIDGTADKPIRMIADPDSKTRPVFDFQNLKGGFAHGGDYWYMRGFDVCNAADGSAGIRIYGHYNTLDQVNAYGNGKTGISISTKESASDKKDIDWPSNNLILNCTSHNNADKGYEDADGFEAKLTCGEGNVFDGCVAYNNADDGWDLYARLSSGPIGVVTIRNCVAYGNGYLEDGTNAGNGNGFKLGGDGIAVKHKIINSVAFNNKADGITSNSNPDVIVENCTSYNNEGRNIDLRGKGDQTDFAVNGFIGFKDDTIKSGLSTAESFAPAGNQDAAKYNGDNDYYWNGSDSANGKGDKVTADMFKSLKFEGSVARNADGTINLNGFLMLNDKAPENTGADFAKEGGSTPSKDIGEIIPDENLPNPETGFAPFIGLTVLAGAVAAVCVFNKKRNR